MAKSLKRTGNQKNMTGLPEELRMTLASVVACYQQLLKDDFCSLVLFGSYGRGDWDGQSDLDLLLIAKKLPANLWEREIMVRKPLYDMIKKHFTVIAKTEEEFSSYFPSFYLDLGLDGIIIYDRNNFLTQRFKRIRQIIKEAGLKRIKIPTSGRKKEEFTWKWKNPPKRGWEINWTGFHEL